MAFSKSRPMKNRSRSILSDPSTPDPVKGHVLVREMPLPADPEANRDLHPRHNEEVVKPGEV